ncbi:SPOR domain-containing protein [Onishia taeanensis]
MRERVSGAVILVALAVIFLPMLFDDPVSRDERPQPMLSIEAPMQVERVEVDEPEPPSRLDEAPSRDAASVAGEPGEASRASNGDDRAASQAPTATSREPSAESQEPSAESQAPTAASSQEPAVATSQPASTSQATADAEAPEDPIAELARAAEAKRVAAGEWSVQAGSFGEPGNAERLEQQLEAKGFNAYRRPRGNDLTAVYVGPFASAEEGERARGELKTKANLQGLVVRMSP